MTIQDQNSKSWLVIWEEYQQKHLGRVEDPETSGLPFYTTNDPRMMNHKEEIIEEKKGENKVMQNTNQNTQRYEEPVPAGRYVVEVMEMKPGKTKSGHPDVDMRMRIQCTPEPEKDYTYHNRSLFNHQPVDNPIGLSVMKRILTQMNLDCLKDVDMNSLDMEGLYGVLPECMKELDQLGMEVTLSYRNNYPQYNDWDFA
jgi:hypothetical protein